MERFKQEYLGCFEDHRHTLSIEAYREYDSMCEAYDRLVCSILTEEGVAMPLDGLERGKVNRNAKTVRALIIKKYDITDEEFQNAARSYRF